jgi:hypothetical protein
MFLHFNLPSFPSLFPIMQLHKLFIAITLPKVLYFGEYAFSTLPSRCLGIHDAPTSLIPWQSCSMYEILWLKDIKSWVQNCTIYSLAINRGSENGPVIPSSDLGCCVLWSLNHGIWLSILPAHLQKENLKSRRPTDFYFSLWSKVNMAWFLKIDKIIYVLRYDW